MRTAVHLPFCLTTHTTTPTTRMTSKTGHIPPPIQPMPHPPPFIVFPVCAKATPVANSGTVPTAKTSKVFIKCPKGNDKTSGPLWQRARETERASRRPANPGNASQTPQAPQSLRLPFSAGQRASESVTRWSESKLKCCRRPCASEHSLAATIGFILARAPLPRQCNPWSD